MGMIWAIRDGKMPLAHIIAHGDRLLGQALHLLEHQRKGERVVMSAVSVVTSVVNKSEVVYHKNFPQTDGIPVGWLTAKINLITDLVVVACQQIAG